MQQTSPHPIRSSAPGLTSAILLLAILAAFFASLPCLRAQQSDSEITSVLTQGCWSSDPRRPHHLIAFFRDGTCLFSNIYPDGSLGPRVWHGTWQISNGSVIVSFPSSASQNTFSQPISPFGTRGVDKNQQPLTMVREDVTVKEPAPDQGAAPVARPPRTRDADATADAATLPIPADVQQAASRLIQTYHDSLVFVTGSAAAGSGFIGALGNANFLITNVHVAAGIRDAAFKTLDGVTVQGGVPSMAIGEDIFCMAYQAGGKPFPIMQKVDENAAIGDYVVVLGNAEGQGVVNTLIGRIVGIGPNLVEIDAPFVPGNSGSPIIHLKTGQVIGVATYLVTNQYDLTTDQQLKKPVVRRFGYRLDSIKGWQAVNWRSFDAQAAEMDDIETLTNDLYDFFLDLDEHKGVVTPGRHTNPVIKTRIDDWLDAKSHNPSAEDSDIADANFLSFLKIACQSDITAARSQVTYDYFRRELADQKGIRDQMSAAFQQIIQNLRQ